MGNISSNYNRLKDLIDLDKVEIRKLKAILQTLEFRVNNLEELKRLLEPSLEEEEQYEISEGLEKTYLVGFLPTDYKMPEDYTKSFYPDNYPY